MSDLDLELLLQRARGTIPAHGAKTRLRSRVISAAAGGAALTTAAHVAAKPALLAWLGSSKLVSLGISVAGGAAVGALVLAPLLWHREEPKQRPTPSTAASSPVQVAETPSAHTLAESPSPAPLPSIRATLPKPAPSQAAVPSIERETALLSEAQRALRSGGAQAALRILDSYDREIGRGVLSEEAAATRAISTCTLSKAGRASSLAAFRQAHPSSPLLPRVQAACLGEASHDDFELDSPNPTTKVRER